MESQTWFHVSVLPAVLSWLPCTQGLREYLANHWVNVKEEWGKLAVDSIGKFSHLSEERDNSWELNPLVFALLLGVNMTQNHVRVTLKSSMATQVGQRLFSKRLVCLGWKTLQTRVQALFTAGISCTSTWKRKLRGNPKSNGEITPGFGDKLLYVISLKVSANTTMPIILRSIKL